MESVDKKQLWISLLRKSWIVIFAAFIAMAMSFIVTHFFITPQYEASTKMYVNNSSFSGGTSASFSASELTAAQGLVNTYIVILNSRPTLENVIQEANLNYAPEQLVDMITAKAVNDTEIFEVTVSSPSSYEAELIANTIAKVLPQKIAETVDGSSVRIVDYAVRPTQPSSPSYLKNMFLGFLIGAALSATALIFFQLMDDKVRSEEHLSSAYPEIPLLTVVPDIYAAKKDGYYKGRRKDSYKYAQRKTEDR